MIILFMITYCSHLFYLGSEPHCLDLGLPLGLSGFGALTGTVDRTGGHRWPGHASSQCRSCGNSPAGTGAHTVRGTADRQVDGHSQHPRHLGPPEAQKLLQTFIWKNKTNRTMAEIPGTRSCPSYLALLDKAEPMALGC